MNTKNYMIIDFETLSTNPKTTDPIQLSALVVDGIKLEIIENSTFDSYIRPDKFDEKGYIDEHRPTIDWHCKNLGLKLEEFLAIIDKAPSEKFVWNNFVEYTMNYHTRAKSRNMFSAPILAGYNIFNFDCIILDRLCKKYKTKIDKDGNAGLFYNRDSIDILKIIYMWFESTDRLPNLKMDTLRQYFGIDMNNAHNGIKDCRDEAMLLIKFLKLHRQVLPHINFNKVD